MFLTKVYKHSKVLFIAMILFIVLQLFINFKRGVVMSPFYHFGMYSEVMPVKPTYPVMEVFVDGKMLQGKNFSQQQWDKILLPPLYFINLQSKSNALYHQDIERLLAKIEIQPNQQFFIASCDYNRFMSWYKPYLQKIIKMNVKQVDIYVKDYQFNNTLQATANQSHISSLCQ
jgi:hypothetical protein